MTFGECVVSYSLRGVGAYDIIILESHENPIEVARQRIFEIKKNIIIKTNMKRS